MKSIEVAEQRAGLVAQARQILDRAEAEERNPTAEENEQYDRMMADVQKLGEEKAKLERAEKLEVVEAEIKHADHGRKVQPGSFIRSAPSNNENEYREAFRTWVLHGTKFADSDPSKIQRAAECGLNPYQRSITFDRAQAVGTGSAGGYLITNGFVTEVEKALKYVCPLRQIARVMPTATGESRLWPTVDDTSNNGTAPLAENTEETYTDVAFGQKTIASYEYSSDLVKAPIVWFRDALVDPLVLLAELLAERINRKQEGHFATGTGSSQPQGIVTGAGNSSVTTTSTSAIDFDNLIDLYHSVDIAYRNSPSCGWLMSDATAAYLSKVKDDVGQYIWQPSVVAGQPDRIRNKPVYICNQMVTLGGTSRKVVLFGDMSKFVIRDVGTLEVTSSNERFMEFRQIAVVAHASASSLVVNSAAIKYMATPAS